MTAQLGAYRARLEAGLVRQSRLESAIEAGVNIGSGFLVALVVWFFIAPLYGYEITFVDNIGLTSIFTVVSITRSYIWRRFFEARIRRRIAHANV